MLLMVSNRQKKPYRELSESVGGRPRCACMHMSSVDEGLGGLSNLFQQFRQPLQGTQLFLFPLCTTATATELNIECSTASNQRL